MRKVAYVLPRLSNLRSEVIPPDPIAIIWDLVHVLSRFVQVMIPDQISGPKCYDYGTYNLVFTSTLNNNYGCVYHKSTIWTIARFLQSTSTWNNKDLSRNWACVPNALLNHQLKCLNNVQAIGRLLRLCHATLWRSRKQGHITRSSATKNTCPSLDNELIWSSPSCFKLYDCKVMFAFTESQLRLGW